MCIRDSFYAVCGMWRLARFNVDASVIHGYFMGVPIPDGGCLIATWILLSTHLGITPAMQIDTCLLYTSLAI